MSDTPAPGVEAAFKSFLEKFWPTWRSFEDAPVYETVRQSFLAGFDYAAYVAVRHVAEVPMATAARRRPADYATLTPQQQWVVDKELGILDWDGDPDK